MILGIVNDDLDAVVAVQLQGSESLQVEAVIDSGFTEFLTLPLALIQQMGFEFVSAEKTTLADGSEIEMDDYRGKVFWDGELRAIIVTCSECNPLIGMSMLKGFDLYVRVVPGGDVRIAKVLSAENSL